ncbi:MAG: hypothetical protein EBU07_13305 [Betaproteobacteria bacterium]|jgi:uncharacterized membrane protein YqjE|nr:hypothetical protein [Betaproteobacteria bacterium]
MFGRVLGLIEALRAGLAAGLSFVEARSELLALEWAEERRRLFDALWGLALAVLLCAAALVLLLLLLLWSVPESARPIACGGLGAGLLVAGLYALRRARMRLERSPPPWQASRDELRRDIDSLRGRN